MGSYTHPKFSAFERIWPSRDRLPAKFAPPESANTLLEPHCTCSELVAIVWTGNVLESCPIAGGFTDNGTR